MMARGVTGLSFGRMIALVGIKGATRQRGLELRLRDAGKDLGFWLWPLGAGRCKCSTLRCKPHFNSKTTHLEKRSLLPNERHTQSPTHEVGNLGVLPAPESKSWQFRAKPKSCGNLEVLSGDVCPAPVDAEVLGNRLVGALVGDGNVPLGVMAHVAALTDQCIACHALGRHGRYVRWGKLAAGHALDEVRVLPKLSSIQSELVSRGVGAQDVHGLCAHLGILKVRLDCPQLLLVLARDVLVTSVQALHDTLRGAHPLQRHKAAQNR